VIRVLHRKGVANAPEYLLAGVGKTGGFVLSNRTI
jgi:hypothetical protein